MTMEKWSVDRDDRRDVSPAWQATRLAPWLAALALGAIAWIAALGYRHFMHEPHEAAPPPFAQETPQAPAIPAAPPPPVSHRIEPPPAAQRLPAVDKSDPMARRALTTLMGRKAFERFMVPDQLVRRIVATVDNLPRRTAATRTLPVAAVPGRFAVAPGPEGAVLDRANFERYGPYVRVVERIEARPLVQVYARAYPLFQRAYEDLGFPGRYFNDRLLEALGDMLEAPELEAAVPLAREKVLYQFADPDLEGRSAGQKILMRMGAANAARVKAKLAEIRREILAVSKPAQ